MEFGFRTNQNERFVLACNIDQIGTECSMQCPHFQQHEHEGRSGLGNTCTSVSHTVAEMNSHFPLVNEIDFGRLFRAVRKLKTGGNSRRRRRKNNSNRFEDKSTISQWCTYKKGNQPRVACVALATRSTWAGEITDFQFRGMRRSKSYSIRCLCSWWKKLATNCMKNGSAVVKKQQPNKLRC